MPQKSLKIALGQESSSQAGIRPLRAHLIGIGGIGTSALARYFLSQGWQVSGSDKTPSPLLQELKAEGAKIRIGHQRKNLKPKPDLVVYTQATASSNPELKETKRLKIKILSYPKALGQLTRNFTTIAIAGAHGKSTATALTALVLMEAKMNPTVIVGTKIPQLKDRNFRAGKSKYLVIEADEYKDAFLNYSPRAALITNIDREHLDYFKNLNNIKKSFLKFINNLEEGGIVVLNKDSTPLLSLKKDLHFVTTTRGKKIIWYSLEEKKLTQKIKKHLKIPGQHNLSNALGVYKLARSLGIKEKNILYVFSHYQGSWRRMEYKGNLKLSARGGSPPEAGVPLEHGFGGKIPVFDDYAHHPTEIKATLAAFREKFPKAKIICVFQPHQAERLKKLFKAFTTAFDEADALILLDVFRVAGRENQKSKGKRQNYNSKVKNDSEALAKAIQKGRGGPKVAYLPKPNSLRNSIIQILLKTENWKLKNHPPKAVIIMMGAGDIVNLTLRLIK